jgi:hypothetical protein
MITYHSSKTNNFYKTEEAAFEAESNFDAEQAEKNAKCEELAKTQKVRKEGVEKAFKEAYTLLDEYVKDYGRFSGKIDIPTNKPSLFDSLFNFWF